MGACFLWLCALATAGSSSMAADISPTACLENTGQYALEQLHHWWPRAGAHNRSAVVGVRRRRLEAAQTLRAKVCSYSISPPRINDTSPCVVFEVRASGHDACAAGGTSWVTEALTTELRQCAVRDRFNGDYLVSCARPAAGACASYSLNVVFEVFHAFHNGEAGGGTIAADSGMKRTGQNSKWATRHCEPAAPTPLAATGAAANRSSCVWRAASAATTTAPRAWWQQKFVWVDGAGVEQVASRAHDAQFATCFAHKLRNVHFIGASHINYFASCLAQDLYGVWRTRRCDGFLKGNHLSPADAAAFAYYKYCGPRPEGCLQNLSAIQCWDGQHDAILAAGGLQGAVCAWPVTSLTSSAMVLRLLALYPEYWSGEGAVSGGGKLISCRAARDAPCTLPWDARDVLVVQGGAWDSAAERDVREFLDDDGDLGQFVDAVRVLRADARFAGARIILMTTVAPTSASTGWRRSVVMMWHRRIGSRSSQRGVTAILAQRSGDRGRERGGAPRARDHVQRARRRSV